jgi:hypothetical protein
MSPIEQGEFSLKTKPQFTFQDRTFKPVSDGQLAGFRNMNGPPGPLLYS